MKIVLNDIAYTGSYERNGQDFTLMLGSPPSVREGDALTVSFYEGERLLFTLYRRVAQSVRGNTVYARLEEEALPVEERVENLEQSLSDLLNGVTEDA